jgi:dTDP-4-dehydrorhamnose 3,5-epimerase-like enzyme
MGVLKWDDADLGIRWPVNSDDARLSDKDWKQPALKEKAPAFVP